MRVVSRGGRGRGSRIASLGSRLVSDQRPPQARPEDRAALRVERRHAQHQRVVDGRTAARSGGGRASRGPCRSGRGPRCRRRSRRTRAGHDDEPVRRARSPSTAIRSSPSLISNGTTWRSSSNASQRRPARSSSAACAAARAGDGPRPPTAPRRVHAASDPDVARGAAGRGRDRLRAPGRPGSTARIRPIRAPGPMPRIAATTAASSARRRRRSRRGGSPGR